MFLNQHIILNYPTLLLYEICFVVEPVAKPSLSAPQRSVSSAPQSAALARFSQQSEKFMIKKSGTPLPKNTLRYSEDTQTSEVCAGWKDIVI